MTRQWHIALAFVFLGLLLVVSPLGTAHFVPGPETQVTSGTNNPTGPSAYADRVAWSDSRGSNRDIYVRNLTTGVETRVTTSTATQSDPAMAGNWIIYHEDGLTIVNAPFQAIKAYNLTTGTTRTIASAGGSTFGSPATDDRTVVYTGVVGGLTQIFLHDLVANTTIQFTTGGGDKYDPVVSGALVAWTETRYGAFDHDIFLKNRTSRQETLITLSTNSDTRPFLTPTHLFWQDGRAGYQTYVRPHATGVSAPVHAAAEVQRDPVASLTPAGVVVAWTEEATVGERIYNVAYTILGQSWVRYAEATWDRAHQPSISGASLAFLSNRNSGQIVRVLLDLTPPVTTATASDVAQNGWYKANVSVTLGATDTGGVGVENITRSLDGAANTTYTTPVAVNGEGSHVLRYFATDHANNAEALATLALHLDLTPPNVNVTLAGTKDTNYRSSVTVTFTASDALSGPSTRTYRLDGGPPLTYTAPFVVSAEGAHTVIASATDVAGNSASQTVNFIIDLTPPTTSFAPTGTAGNASWFRGPVSLAVVCADNFGCASSQARLGSASFAPYTTPLAVSADGTTTAQAYSTDTAGNVGTTSTFPVRIDTVAPIASIALAGPKDVNYRGNVTVTLSATDASSGVGTIMYRLDGDILRTYTAPFVVSAAGTHSLQTYAIDVAGNGGPVATSTFFIDLSPPVTMFNISGVPGNAPWFKSPVTIGVDCVDNVACASSHVRVGGGVYATYTSPFAFATEGATPVDAYSIDTAGNVGLTNSTVVRIDTVPPTASVALAGPKDVNYRDSVTITLSATDATSGVGSIRYRLDGGADSLYTSPLVVASAGSHTVSAYAIDTGGNTGATVNTTFLLDLSPPVTSVALAGTIGNATWYRSPVWVTVTCVDNIACASSKTLLTPPGIWQNYSAPFAVSAEGATLQAADSLDTAGNLGAAPSTTIRIDTGSPLSTLTPSRAPDAAGWYRGPVTFTLSATDATSGVASRVLIVDNVLQPGTVATLSTDGVHALRYYATDVAGNIETSRLLFVQYDATPPTTEARLDAIEGLAPGYYRGAAQLLFDASDAGSGVATTYAQNGGTQVVTSPIPIPSDGVYSFIYHSVDVAGNIESDDRITFTLDNVEPVLTLTAPVSGALYRETLTPSVVADEPIAQWFAELDGIPVSNWLPGTTIPLTTGIHTLVIGAYDRSGNLATVATSFQAKTGHAVVAVPLSDGFCPAERDFDHPSIAAALADTRDGDTILVCPGEHTESIVVDHEVWIQGVPHDSAFPTIAGAVYDEPTVSVMSPNVVLLDLVLRPTQGATWEQPSILRAEGAHGLRVAQLDIEGGVIDVHVLGTNDMSIRDSRIARSFEHGLLIDEGRDILLTDNVIDEHEVHAVTFTGERITARDNEIDADRVGILSVRSEGALIEGNQIRSDDALILRSAVGPVIMDNDIRAQTHGVWLVDAADADVAVNRLWSLWGATQRVFQSNAELIRVDGGTLNSLRDNVLFGGSFGIIVDRATETMVQGNQLALFGTGILLSHLSEPIATVVEGNLLTLPAIPVGSEDPATGPARVGIVLTESQGAIHIRDNIVQNASVGLRIFNSVDTVIEDNTITGATRWGVDFLGDATSNRLDRNFVDGKELHHYLGAEFPGDLSGQVYFGERLSNLGQVIVVNVTGARFFDNLHVGSRSSGLFLRNVDGAVVEKLRAYSNGIGVRFENSRGGQVLGIDAYANGIGIDINRSSNIVTSRGLIVENGVGVRGELSDALLVTQSLFSANSFGVELNNTDRVTIHHIQSQNDSSLLRANNSLRLALTAVPGLRATYARNTIPTLADPVGIVYAKGSGVIAERSTLTLNAITFYEGDSFDVQSRGGSAIGTNVRIGAQDASFTLVHAGIQRETKVLPADPRGHLTSANRAFKITPLGTGSVSLTLAYDPSVDFPLASAYEESLGLYAYNVAKGWWEPHADTTRTLNTVTNILTTQILLRKDAPAFPLQAFVNPSRMTVVDKDAPCTYGARAFTTVTAAALDAASVTQEPTTTLVCAGTYPETVALRALGQRLTGIEGPTAVLVPTLTPSQSTPSTLRLGAPGIRIDNLTITRFLTTGVLGQTPEGILVEAAAHNATISDVHISEHQDAIAIVAPDVRVERLLLRESVTGVRLAQGAARTVIKDSTVENAKWGVRITQDGGTSVLNNTFTGVTVGVHLSSGATVDPASVPLTSRIGVNAPVDDLAKMLADGSQLLVPLTRSVVRGNTITASRWGILSEETERNLRLEGNFITVLNSPGVLAIHVEDVADGLRIANNTLIGGQVAIELIGEGITAPRIDDNLIGESQFGIATVNVTRASVRNNSVFDASHGIHLANSSQGRLEDNLVIGAQQFGIVIDTGSHGSIVARNNVSEVEDVSPESIPTIGIWVASATDVLVERNRLFSPGARGIQWDDNAHRTTVANNRVHGASESGLVSLLNWDSRVMNNLVSMVKPECEDACSLPATIGIRIDGGTNRAKVNNNTVSGGWNGIVIGSSSAATISNVNVSENFVRGAYEANVKFARGAIGNTLWSNYLMGEKGVYPGEPQLSTKWNVLIYGKGAGPAPDQNRISENTLAGQINQGAYETTDVGTTYWINDKGDKGGNFWGDYAERVCKGNTNVCHPPAADPTCKPRGTTRFCLAGYPVYSDPPRAPYDANPLKTPVANVPLDLVMFVASLSPTTRQVDTQVVDLFGQAVASDGVPLEYRHVNVPCTFCASLAGLSTTSFAADDVGKFALPIATTDKAGVANNWFTFLAASTHAGSNKAEGIASWTEQNKHATHELDPFLELPTIKKIKRAFGTYLPSGYQARENGAQASIDWKSTITPFDVSMEVEGFPTVTKDMRTPNGDPLGVHWKEGQAHVTEHSRTFALAGLPRGPLPVTVRAIGDSGATSDTKVLLYIVDPAEGFPSFTKACPEEPVKNYTNSDPTLLYENMFRFNSAGPTAELRSDALAVTAYLNVATSQLMVNYNGGGCGPSSGFYFILDVRMDSPVSGDLEVGVHNKWVSTAHYGNDALAFTLTIGPSVANLNIDLATFAMVGTYTDGPIDAQLIINDKTFIAKYKDAAGEISLDLALDKKDGNFVYDRVGQEKIKGKFKGSQQTATFSTSEAYVTFSWKNNNKVGTIQVNGQTTNFNANAAITCDQTGPACDLVKNTFAPLLSLMSTVGNGIDKTFSLVTTAIDIGGLVGTARDVIDSVSAVNTALQTLQSLPGASASSSADRPSGMGGKVGMSPSLSISLGQKATFDTKTGAAWQTMGLGVGYGDPPPSGVEDMKIGQDLTVVVTAGHDQYAYPNAAKDQLKMERAETFLEFGAGGIPIIDIDVVVARVSITGQASITVNLVQRPDVAGEMEFTGGSADISGGITGGVSVDVWMASASVTVSVDIGLGGSVSNGDVRLDSFRTAATVRVDWAVLVYSDHWGRKWTCDMVQKKCWETEASRPEGWRVNPRYYLNDDYGRWVAGQPGTTEVTQRSNDGVTRTSVATLLEGAYPEANPSLAVSPDGLKLLVFANDNVSKPALSGLEILSTWSTGDAWSDPVPVVSDEMAHSDPAVAFDVHGRGLALWTRMDTTQIGADSLDPEELAPHVEIAYALFDPLARVWSAPALLTQNAYLDWFPRIAQGPDGKLIATWMALPSNDLVIGGESINSTAMRQELRYAVWDGASWSAPMVLAQDVALVTRAQVAGDGGNATAIWAQDLDGNTRTAADREIFAARWSGNGFGPAERLTNNDVEEAYPVAHHNTDGLGVVTWLERAANETSLVWRADLDGVWSAPRANTNVGANELNAARDARGIPVLITQSASGNGTVASYAVYDATTNDWSPPRELRSGQDRDAKFSAVIDADNVLYVAQVHTQLLWINETRPSGDPENDPLNASQSFEVRMPWDGNSSLRVMRHPLFVDASVRADEASLLFPHAPERGSVIDLKAVVTNTGDVPLDDLGVRFVADGVDLVGTVRIPHLSAGRNANITLPWLVPLVGPIPDVHVIVDPFHEISEDDETNNTATFRVARPDLAVGLVDLEEQPDGSALVNVTVRNLGLAASGPTTISFVVTEDPFGDTKAAAASTAAIASIEPGASLIVSHTLAPESLLTGQHFVYVYADREDLLPEVSEQNNMGRALVFATGDLALWHGAIRLETDLAGATNILIDVANDAAWPVADATVAVFAGAPYKQVGKTRQLDLDAQLARVSTGPILPHSTVTISIPYTSVAGIATLYALADPDDDIRETDETNNLGRMDARVVARLQLREVPQDPTDALRPVHVAADHPATSETRYTVLVEARNVARDRTHATAKLFTPDANGSVEFRAGILADAIENLSGIYDVTMTIADASGPIARGSMVLDVVVAAVPDLFHSGPFAADEGASFDASAVGTTHPLGVPLAYAWDWGDGTRSEGMFATKTYGDDGDYSVTLEVFDGTSTTRALTVARVRNLAPTLAFEAKPLGIDAVDGPLEGRAVVLPMGRLNATVRLADAGSDDLTLRIEWGDGTQEEILFPSDPSGDLDWHLSPHGGPTSVVANITHEYPLGAWTLRIVVIDDDGGEATLSRTVISVSTQVQPPAAPEPEVVVTSTITLPAELPPAPLIAVNLPGRGKTTAGRPKSNLPESGRWPPGRSSSSLSQAPSSRGVRPLEAS